MPRIESDTASRALDRIAKGGARTRIREPLRTQGRQRFRRATNWFGEVDFRGVALHVLPTCPRERRRADAVADRVQQVFVNPFSSSPRCAFRVDCFWFSGWTRPLTWWETSALDEYAAPSSAPRARTSAECDACREGRTVVIAARACSPCGRENDKNGDAVVTMIRGRIRRRARPRAAERRKEIRPSVGCEGDSDHDRDPKERAVLGRARKRAERTNAVPIREPHSRTGPPRSSPRTGRSRSA